MAELSGRPQFTFTSFFVCKILRKRHFFSKIHSKCQFKDVKKFAGFGVVVTITVQNILPRGVGGLGGKVSNCKVNCLYSMLRQNAT